MSAREPGSGSESNADGGSKSNPGSEDRVRRGRESTAGNALERVRTEPRTHAVAVLAAVVIGLVASWLHWSGLVVGGALVGLVSASLPRAALGAIGFGVLVLVAFAVSLGGSTGVVLEMTPVVYLVVASAIGLPLLGSLVRGVV